MHRHKALECYAMSALLLFVSTLLLTKSFSFEAVEAKKRLRQQPRFLSDNYAYLAKRVVYGGLDALHLAVRYKCPSILREARELQDYGTLVSRASRLRTTKPDTPMLYFFANGKQEPNNVIEYKHEAVASIPASILDSQDVNASFNDMLISKAKFEPNKLTYLLVHGWRGGLDHEKWLDIAKYSAATSATSGNSSAPNIQRANVIVVDWSKLSGNSLFTATSHAVLVADRLARMLKHMVDHHKLNMNLVHCLGHSLGTHICGQAARAVRVDIDTTNNCVVRDKRPKMGRISGIDPGGYCYELDADDELNYTGLKTSDAIVVEALYSNRAPLGNKYPLVQYNVDINDGYTQPACDVKASPTFGAKYQQAVIDYMRGVKSANEILVCDHFFAATLSAEMLGKRHSDSCNYLAVECDSYDNYALGKCGSSESSRPTSFYEIDMSGHWIDKMAPASNRAQATNSSDSQQCFQVSTHRRQRGRLTKRDLWTLSKNDDDIGFDAFYSDNNVDDFGLKKLERHARRSNKHDRDDNDKQNDASASNSSEHLRPSKKGHNAMTLGKTRQRFFVHTRKKSPYCSHTFRVQVAIKVNVERQQQQQQPRVSKRMPKSLRSTVKSIFNFGLNGNNKHTKASPMAYLNLKPSSGASDDFVGVHNIHSGKIDKNIELFGPWPSDAFITGQNDEVRYLTGMFDLHERFDWLVNSQMAGNKYIFDRLTLQLTPELGKLLHIGSNQTSFIKSLSVEYIGSADSSIRSKFTRRFSDDEIQLSINK